MDEKGFTTVAYNRDDEFAVNIEKTVKKGNRVLGAHTMEDMAAIPFSRCYFMVST